MHGGDVLAAIENRLLRHAKMHQISVECIEQFQKTRLLSEAIVVELGDLHRKVRVSWPPILPVFFAHQYGVLVGGIDLLEIVQQTLYIAAGAAVDDAGVDGDVGHDNSFLLIFSSVCSISIND